MENEILSSLQKVRQKFDQHLLFRFDSNAKVEDIVVGLRFIKYILTLSEEKLDEINSYKSEFAVLTEKCSNVEFCVENGKICIYVQNDEFNEKNNSYKEMVTSNEYLSSDQTLSFPIGRDFYGKIHIADLKNLGSLLCTGFVGSCNAEIMENIILSLSSKFSPEELKLILVEPKNYNLKTFDVFEQLPHLLGKKVFKDSEEILTTLNSVVDEVNRRTDILTSFGAPTIDAYNNSEQVKSGKINKIPYALVLINKFENVISIDTAKIERFIQILTAKAKSCGIYLVIATEKTTSDVLTNIVMKHIHSKLIFKTKIVSSNYIDILPDAQKLFPHGDFYFLPFGAKTPIRLQYPYIDYNECKEMISNISSMYK